MIVATFVQIVFGRIACAASTVNASVVAELAARMLAGYGAAGSRRNDTVPATFVKIQPFGRFVAAAELVSANCGFSVSEMTRS